MRVLFEVTPVSMSAFAKAAKICVTLFGRYLKSWFSSGGVVKRQEVDVGSWLKMVGNGWNDFEMI